MRPSILVSITVFITGVVGLDININAGTYCPGTLWNTVCCVEGTWSGPVISAFNNEVQSASSSVSNIQSSIESRISSVQQNGPSIRSSVDSQFATVINPPKRARAITTEISSGLTCNGITGITATDDGASQRIASATSAASSIYTRTEISIAVRNGNTLVASGIAPTGATSKAGAAMATQAPILVVGAMVLAYGAM